MFVHPQLGMFELGGDVGRVPALDTSSNYTSWVRLARVNSTPHCVGRPCVRLLRLPYPRFPSTTTVCPGIQVSNPVGLKQGTYRRTEARPSTPPMDLLNAIVLPVTGFSIYSIIGFFIILHVIAFGVLAYIHVTTKKGPDFKGKLA